MQDPASFIGELLIPVALLVVVWVAQAAGLVVSVQSDEHCGIDVAHVRVTVEHYLGDAFVQKCIAASGIIVDRVAMRPHPGVLGGGAQMHRLAHRR